MNEDIYFEPDELCSLCHCDHSNEDHETCAVNLKHDLNEAFNELTQLKSQLKREQDALDRLIELDQEDCSFDHNGCCQMHWLEFDCSMKNARETVKMRGEGV